MRGKLQRIEPVLKFSRTSCRFGAGRDRCSGLEEKYLTAATCSHERCEPYSKHILALLTSRSRSRNAMRLHQTLLVCVISKSGECSVEFVIYITLIMNFKKYGYSQNLILKSMGENVIVNPQNN
jgi:hypothetical protein